MCNTKLADYLVVRGDVGHVSGLVLKCGDRVAFRVDPGMSDAAAATIARSATVGTNEVRLHGCSNRGGTRSGTTRPVGPGLGCRAPMRSKKCGLLGNLGTRRSMRMQATCGLT